MPQAADSNEPVCQWCLKDLDEKPSFAFLLFKNTSLCLECSEKLIRKRKTVRFDRVKAEVLYESSEGFHKMWDQYAGRKDAALASVFLQPWPDLIRKLKRKTVHADSLETARILRAWNIAAKKADFRKGDIWIGSSPESLKKLPHPEKYKKIILLHAPLKGRGTIRVQAEKIFDKIRQF